MQPTDPNLEAHRGGEGQPSISIVVALVATLLCASARDAFAGQGPAKPEVPVHVLPGATPFKLSGVSLSSGDVNGDGWQDVIAGSFGRVRVFSGKTGEFWLDIGPLSPNTTFGQKVACAGDVDGDGHADIVVGDPGLQPAPGKVYVISGKDGSVLFAHQGASGAEELGRTVAGGVDLNGDGVPDFAAGARDLVRAYSGATGEELWAWGGDCGYVVSVLGDITGDGCGEVLTSCGVDGVRVISGKEGRTLMTIPYPNTQTSFTYFGSALARVGDIDGDGIEDFAVSAPGTRANGLISSGRVHIYSGADGSELLALDGIYEFKALGGSVAGIGDVDGDGVPDIIAGAAGTFDPTAHVFSGATGAMLYELRGANYNTLWPASFGSAVTGLGDLNGDGLADFAVGYPRDHTFGTDAGSTYVYLASSKDPVVYCPAKPNSQGCVPEISSSGLFSLTVGEGIHVKASKVINQQFGLLAWSLGRDSQAFFGGTLCLAPPIVRTAVQSSGGNTGSADCSGAFSFHFSQDHAALLALPPGTTLHAQYWQRDPAHPDGTGVGLTGGLAFTVHP